MRLVGWILWGVGLHHTLRWQSKEMDDVFDDRYPTHT